MLGVLFAFGNSVSRVIHSALLGAQVSIVGLNQLLSSRLPGLIDTYPGAISPFAKSGVPHVEQNPLSVQRPDSPNVR